jgi:hypothetical protein
MLACRRPAGKASVAAVAVVQARRQAIPLPSLRILNPAAAGCDKLVRAARFAKKGL